MVVNYYFGFELLKAKERTTPLFLFEATMGFEPMMRVLQTLALPLGDVAVKTDC